jgi:hypothetical protein
LDSPASLYWELIPEDGVALASGGLVLVSLRRRTRPRISPTAG